MAAVKELGETGIRAVTGIAKIGVTGIETADKAAKLGSDVALESGRIGAKGGTTAAEGVGMAAAKISTKLTEGVGTAATEAASGITKETGVAAVQINKALGKTATALTDSAGKLSVNLTESAGEGAVSLTKQNFKGVNEIVSNSYGIINGVFSALSGTAKITTDAITHQIKENRALQNTRKYIEEHGFSEAIKRQIRQDVANMVDNAVLALESIQRGLDISLESSYKEYRTLLRCRENHTDLYYTNNRITSEIYPVCPNIDIPVSKTSKKTMKISPVGYIRKIINDIKNTIDIGVSMEKEKCALAEMKSCSFTGFRVRIGYLKAMRTSIPTISEGQNAADAYDKFFASFAERIESILRIDDIITYFNYRIRFLNKKMKEALGKASPGENVEVDGGERRRSRRDRRRVSRRMRRRRSGRRKTSRR